MTVTIDWAEMCTKYQGSYVALRDKGDTLHVAVVATGDTFREAEDNAKKNGYPDAWIVCVQEDNTLLVGGYEFSLSDIHSAGKV